MPRLLPGLSDADWNYRSQRHAIELRFDGEFQPELRQQFALWLKLGYSERNGGLLATANDLFAMVASGKIKIEISKTYDLRDAPRAHADMEARKTTGSIVLVV